MFRLADNIDTMTVVTFTRFQSQGGEPRGLFLVGPRKLFVFDIIAIQDDPDSICDSIEENGTVYRIGNGTGQVVWI